MKKLVLIALVACSFSFYACSEDEKPSATNNDDNSNRALLVGKTFQMTGLTVDPPADLLGTGAISDIYAEGDDCSKDNRTTFNENGTITVDEGPTKCDPDDPQTTTETWSLNSNQTVLTLDGVPWQIKTLNNSGMTLESSFTDGNTTHVMTGTFKRL